MRLLLDTNVLIDFTEKHESFGFSEPTLFDNAIGTDAFLVSVVSIWEIAIKTRLKKLKLSITLDQISDMVKVAGGIILEISEDHVLARLETEPNTKDPFDRLLLSTAAAEKTLLVTRDRALQPHPLVWQPFPR